MSAKVSEPGVYRSCAIPSGAIQQQLAQLLLLGFLGCSATGPDASGAPGARSMVVPRYTADRELIRPTHYEDWTFVGASIGLGYSESSGRERSDRESPGEFHNVYMQPGAYEEYQRSGKFPEKTMFLLALHEPRQRESINKQGYFEGSLLALEAAVKDHDEFKEGWAYFDFGKAGQGASARAKPPEDCHACHAKHGADDNVFVQFYPALRHLLETKTAGTTAFR